MDIKFSRPIQKVGNCLAIVATRTHRSAQIGMKQFYKSLTLNDRRKITMAARKARAAKIRKRGDI